MTEIDLKARVLALEWALKDLLRHHDAAYAMTAPGIPCGCLRMLAHASVRRAREVLGVAPCDGARLKREETSDEEAGRAIEVRTVASATHTRRRWCSFCSDVMRRLRSPYVRGPPSVCDSERTPRRTPRSSRLSRARTRWRRRAVSGSGLPRTIRSEWVRSLAGCTGSTLRSKRLSATGRRTARMSDA